MSMMYKGNPYKYKKYNGGFLDYAKRAGRKLCPKCNQPFVTVEELARHIQTAHK